MNISIIVPTRGNIGSLQRLIQSLQQQTVDFSFEILIICNPRQPELERRLPKAPNIRIFHSDSSGANIARNIGIHNSSGEILLFIDDDCVIPDADFLRKHLQLHRENPELLGLGGNYLLPSSASLFDLAYFFQQQRWLKSGLKPGFKNDLILGGNFSVKKVELGELRFNESIIYGGTETDFVFQLTKAGKQIRFFEQLKLVHYSELNLRALCTKAFFQGIGAGFLQQKKNYGVPVTNCGRPIEPPKSGALTLCLFLYEVFFRAGVRLQLKTRNSAPHCRSNFAGMCLLASVEAAGVATVSMKRFFFYRIWNTLELVLYSKK